jgi:hypothetical protein
MKNIIAGVAIALVASSTLPRTQTAIAQEPPAPAPEVAPADSGLNDLAAVTFGCPKAALNAAAREAAKVRSQGTYQFSYFKIISDSHHSAFEVHFKSNYNGEKDLKYCVAMYCQQGWDPKTTKTMVTLMNDPRQPPGHAAACTAKAASH